MEIERGLSIKTVANYDRYLSRFSEYSNIADTSHITEEAVKDFRLWLNRQKAGKGSDGRPTTLKHKTVMVRVVSNVCFVIWNRTFALVNLKGCCGSELVIRLKRLESARNGRS